MRNFQTNLSKHHSQIFENKNTQKPHPKKQKKYIYFMKNQEKNVQKMVKKPMLSFFNSKNNLSKSPISPIGSEPVCSEAPWPVEHRFRQLWATAWLPSIGGQHPVVEGGGLVCNPVKFGATGWCLWFNAMKNHHLDWFETFKIGETRLLICPFD